MKEFRYVEIDKRPDGVNAKYKIVELNVYSTYNIIYNSNLLIFDFGRWAIVS
jgi:hypothetical protein